MSDKFQGYFLIQRFLKKLHGQGYDKCYLLYDESKLVGIFDDEIYANRYWLKYIGSKRTITKENDQYEAPNKP